MMQKCIKIYYSCTNYVVKLQIDLNNIHKYCQKNAMYLNLNKCSTIQFSLKRIPM
jgi:hypothetical protein